TILPAIESHARFAMRHLSCGSRRDDAVAEAVALAWLWFRRLTRRGEDATKYVKTLAVFAARAVRSGRHLCGTEQARDVLSERAQRRHTFRVERLPSSLRRPHADIYSLVRGQQEIDSYEERLRDNSVTPPGDAAAFRIDFPQFLHSMNERDRDM